MRTAAESQVSVMVLAACTRQRDNARNHAVEHILGSQLQDPQLNHELLAVLQLSDVSADAEYDELLADARAGPHAG
jgi:hypothetical protein